MDQEGAFGRLFVARCLVVLGVYPLLRLRLLRVSPLRRLTFFTNAPKKSKQKNACSCVRPSQARVPSLRARSGRSGYGLLRCTSFRCVWLRQTVAALPRPDQSLRSASRSRPWIKIKGRRADTRPQGECSLCRSCRRLRSFDLHAVSAKPPAPKPQNPDTKTPGITRAFCIDLINERGK